MKAEHKDFEEQNAIASAMAQPKHEVQNKPLVDDGEGLTVGAAHGIGEGMSAFEAHQRKMEALGVKVEIVTAPSNSILDLPDDVKKNIRNYDELELDEMITRIVTATAFPIKADRIIQQLWTEYKRSPARLKVLARLRFLTGSGVLLKVEGVLSTFSRPPEVK